MWKATIDGMEVPKCSVNFSIKENQINNESILTLNISSSDFPELDKLKVLPSSPRRNTFAISVETDLVFLSCKACWLISCDLGDLEEGAAERATLAFGFKLGYIEDLYD